MIPQEKEIWQHYKTKGEYVILHVGKLQVKEESLDMTDCVIYQSLSDKGIWVRPLVDFIEIVTSEGGEEVARFIKIR